MSESPFNLDKSKILSFGKGWSNGYLFTSSADSAMKNPWVAVSSLTFDPGFIASVLSLPSSDLTSMANNNNFSLAKHSL